MGRKPGQVARQTCTDHCASCGRHFHGLAAFDAHRRDFQCFDPSAIEVGGHPLLQVWTESGYCDLAPGCWRGGYRVRQLHPVTIWQKWQSPTAREWLQDVHANRQKAREPVSVAGEPSTAIPAGNGAIRRGRRPVPA